MDRICKRTASFTAGLKPIVDLDGERRRQEDLREKTVKNLARVQLLFGHEERARGCASRSSEIGNQQERRGLSSRVRGESQASKVEKSEALLVRDW